ncbi:MAG TPA: hypothetical protein VGR02_01830 [Thermoanaerobaculia bacterium]|jgi:hypothetical protein|nr:hypothetical protein [Thermoanaerobaculia bacterium]
MIKRSAIAAALFLGAIIPLLAGVVFLFGCCVLPFHKVIHKAMPMCHVAIDFIRGEHQQQPVPAAEKQEPAKRLVTTSPRTFQLVVASPARRVVPTAGSDYRSFITLGAMRCDSDVGLHLLVATLLI